MKSILIVDVAKGKSIVMLSTEYGEVLIEPKEIKHNLKDFDEMKNKFLLLIALAMFVFSPFSVSAMETLVQLPEGEVISIEVETGDTIEAIKEKIYDNNNYLMDKQKLYYNDSKMIAGRTFGDYYSSSLGNTVKMELDSVVNVILNANGGLFTDKEEYIIEDVYGSASDI